MTISLAAKTSIITISGPIEAITDHLENGGSPIAIEFTGTFIGPFNDDDGEVQDFDTNINKVTLSGFAPEKVSSTYALIGLTDGRQAILQHFFSPAENNPPLNFKATGAIDDIFNDEIPARDFSISITSIELLPSSQEN